LAAATSITGDVVDAVLGERHQIPGGSTRRAGAGLAAALSLTALAVRRRQGPPEPLLVASQGAGPMTQIEAVPELLVEPELVAEPEPEPEPEPELVAEPEPAVEFFREVASECELFIPFAPLRPAAMPSEFFREVASECELVLAGAGRGS
jgi:hypothetical protein